MVKISVVVPVYKAEKYLSKCVDSILNQSFKDFELILVDDGSPDNSGVMCDEYAKLDNRVKTFHKKNGGVSSARQFGLEKASGEYLIFADPDDWIESNMYEELYSDAKKNDADIVICDFFEDYIDGRSIYSCQSSSGFDNLTVIKNLFENLHGSCWNKLVRLNLFRENNVRFPSDINYCEDLIVNIRLLKSAHVISYINKAFYHYTQDVNNNSLERNFSKIRGNENIKLYQIIKEETANFIFQNVCTSRIAHTILSKAFYSNIYSSKEMKEIYGFLLGDIRVLKPLSKKMLFEKLMFLLSLKGYYNLAFNLNRCFKIIYSPIKCFKHKSSI